VADIDIFKTDLASNLELERVFQRHIVDGNSHFFTKFTKRPEDEYALRHEIAKACNCHINEVVIIGSGKMGFSVKSTKLVEFDSEFQTSKKSRDKSDIDVAIISSEFFSQVTQRIFMISDFFAEDWIEEKWKFNSFNLTKDASIFSQYTKYVAKGWARPDFMPNVYLDNAPWKLPLSRWRKHLDRSVSVGIYSNWFFFKTYQINKLADLRSKIQTLSAK
jgi:hypothetical protein